MASNLLLPALHSTYHPKYLQMRQQLRISLSGNRQLGGDLPPWNLLLSQGTPAGGRPLTPPAGCSLIPYTQAGQEGSLGYIILGHGGGPEGEKGGASSADSCILCQAI